MQRQLDDEASTTPELSVPEGESPVPKEDPVVPARTIPRREAPSDAELRERQRLWWSERERFEAAKRKSRSPPEPK